MTFLLDTSAFSDVMSEHPKMAARLASVSAGSKIVICPIVRGEILYGIRRLAPGRRRRELEAKANQLLASIPCRARAGSSERPLRKRKGKLPAAGSARGRKRPLGSSYGDGAWGRPRQPGHRLPKDRRADDRGLDDLRTLGLPGPSRSSANRLVRREAKKMRSVRTLIGLFAIALPLFTAAVARSVDAPPPGEYGTERPGGAGDDPVDLPRDLSGRSVKTPRVRIAIDVPIS